MEKIKCECGHVNPEGTVLCEACGKPIEGNQHIDGNEKQKLLNMRYEGSARRSLTYTRSYIDKVWTFFSSVKVGVWLIVIALAASALGTIFPQQMYIPADAPSRDPAVFYEAQYGIFGKIYYQLGLYELYSSWWYMILIALIGISLVICSLDRFVPLYRALNMQKAKRHKNFVNRQRLYSKSEAISETEVKKIVSRLKKRRYKIMEENGHIMGEKGRFSRWGPYVNHIGLIIVLLAAILRMTPMFYLDEYVWVREGERIVIPGTEGEYEIENKQFILETYDEDDELFQDAIAQAGGMIEKNFQTDVKIYKAKEQSKQGEKQEFELFIEESIYMNNPLKFDGYALYQAGYQLNEFSNMTFKIYEIEDEDAEAVETFTIDLRSPKSDYEFDSGYRVEIHDYFPDYYMDNGEPRSESTYPRNPAFVFNIYPPGEDKPETSFAGIGRNISASDENKYKLGIVDFETHDVSGLTVRRDYTLWLFGIGGFIFMFGVVQGMYWQHRRIWIHPEGDSVLLAAHTNKNWFGIKKDIEHVIKDTSLKMVEDQQELNK